MFFMLRVREHLLPSSPTPFVKNTLGEGSVLINYIPHRDKTDLLAPFQHAALVLL